LPVLVAIAVVHWTDEGGTAALPASTVLAIAAALASVGLSLVGIVLARTAKTAFTAPFVPVSLALRLVGCIIHAFFTCESLVFAGFAYVGAWAPGPDLDVLRLTFSREIFSSCQRFSASQPHRNGRQSEDSAILSRTNPFPLEKFTHSRPRSGAELLGSGEWWAL
jgi:hypothetical protein